MATGHHWLSDGVETLRERIRGSREAPWACDVLVIGSGYGGAVAAARLAGRRTDGRPIDVWVLERGREWLPGTFPARFAELAGAVRFSAQDGAAPRGNLLGLYDMRLGPDVNVVVGSGLGGGSLINAAVMAQPQDDIFDTGWPTGTTAEAMHQHFAAAQLMLQVRPFASGQRPPKLLALDTLARHWAGNQQSNAELAPLAVSGSTEPTPAGVDRQPCKACGDCVTGCNWQAKNSLDVNYLALAHQRGASLFTGVLVLRLRKTGRAGDTVWEVDCTPTQLPAGATVAESALVVRARRVIVSAGALGSTELLQRSQAAGLSLSQRLGKRFSTNGDAIHGAVEHPQVTGISAGDASPADGRMVGPTISGLVRHTHGGQAFVVQEFGIPAPLRRLLAEVTGTFGMLGRVLSSRSSVATHDDPLAAGDEALAHTMIYGVLGDDGAGGRLTSRGSAGSPWDGRVRVEWAGARTHPLFDAQYAALEAAHEAIGGVAVANPAWRPVPTGLGMPQGPTTTVHPLGGCAMGNDASIGVVDGHGRVFDPAAGERGVHDGLAVLDGSIVPRALSINPALTIAALAERAAPALATAWGLHEPRYWPTPRPARQARWQEPVRAAASGTAVRFEERLEGRLTLGNEAFWARLELRFEPVPDLLAFVATRARAMELQSGRLVLFPDRGLDADTPEFDVQPQEPQALWTCAVKGEMQVLRPPERSPVFGERRHIDYRLETIDPPHGSPLGRATRLSGRKTLEADPNTHALRQLIKMDLRVEDESAVEIGSGQLEVDLGDFARRRSPLLSLVAQEDHPTALAELGAFLLFMLRLVFVSHGLNLIRQTDQPSMVHTRRPRDLPDLRREWVPVRDEGHQWGALGLTRYVADSADAADKRPVLLVHGLSAGGSTFAHTHIRVNLVQALCNSGREAWVLELRTSNAFDRHRLADWTLEQVAPDIGTAIDKVREQRGNVQVDVVAHCIGAAIFCLAALQDEALGTKIGAVVLSQVAPVVRLSPLNRLRGYLASYLAQYLGTGLLDTRPDDAGLQQKFVDLLLNAFPYPESDGEAARHRNLKQAHQRCGGDGEVDFRTVRHRADAMFGQLFELANLDDRTLAALDAIFGAVRVKTLAQTIQYARWGLLADETGRNRLISHQTIARNMAFPLLLVHGRRNRVFDWRGSRDAYRLLTGVFGDAPGTDTLAHGRLHLGGGRPRQLMVFDKYGHQDTLIGKGAADEVFPPIIDFLDHAPRSAQQNGPPDPKIVALSPWIGPALGWVRRSADCSYHTVSLQVHPLPSRQRTVALAFVPLVHAPAGDWSPVLNKVRYLFRREGGQLQDLGDFLRHESFELTLGGGDGFTAGERVMVLTMHDDLPGDVGIGTFKLEAAAPGLREAPADGHVDAVREFFDGIRPSDQVLEESSFMLGEEALKAADATVPADSPGPACFVVASCQYPPGLLDAEVADAAWVRLEARLRDADRSQPQWLLLLGDQVYVDETAGVFDPSPDEQVISRAHERTRRLPAQRRVRSQLPAACMLDDHEVGNNWQVRTPLSADEQRALEAYRAWQACLNPPPVLPNSHSFRFAPGGWPVFVLDTRTKRDRRGPGGVPTADARLADVADWAALMKWLGAMPPKVFKFVACPSVILPMERFTPKMGIADRLATDGGSGYPRSQLDLLTTIRDHGIENVVLLAGDAHLSLACTLHIAGGPRVHAIVSSGLYAPWPFANARESDFELDGPVSFSDGRRFVEGRMELHGVWPRNGFVVVRATHLPQPGLCIEFHPVDAQSATQVRLA